MRDWIDGADAALGALQLALARKAEAHADTVMPGFTHLQPAQPVTFGHHLLAYVEMLGARPRPASPMPGRGSTSARWAPPRWPAPPFPIDRHATAEALGFDRPAANSLDAVADRDFALETLAAAAIAAMHLSRLAEEIVIWMTPQFGFVRLSDEFTTGSSIMPQKRNPDAAELVRAKVGRIAGRLPGAADGDEGPAAGLFQGHAGGQGGRLRRVRQPAARRRGHDRHGRGPGAQRRSHGARQPAGGFSTATDLADWLVRAQGLPFREAHHVTGRIVAAAEAKGLALDKLPLADMQAVSPHVTEAVYSVLSVQSSVKSRTSFGGTAPQNVRKMARGWIKRLERAPGRG